ncbi:MAG: C69 family dipeptidase [Anaerolineae bacterium]|nr:C69 family dipeptidase [Anaerolineae bacterium]
MCDTWVAMRDATHAGHVILAKNSDRPIGDCQPLVRHARRTWPAGAVVRLEYVEVAQVSLTYATLGAGPYWCWGYEEGINEHCVAIGNEAIFTKAHREAAEAYSKGMAPECGLLGMDVVRLALERSQTATEAVDWIGRLVERHGQFGSGIAGQGHAEGGYDNSYLVADRDVAWIVETAGHRWVAREVTHGYASISNEPSIRTTWDRGSEDVAAHAVERGWWWAESGPIDFARAYGDERVPRQVSHLRAMRTRQLLRARAGDVTPQWMMRIARDHYEGSFLEGPYFDAAAPDLHTICMHVSPAGFTWGNTASSCIAVLPREEGELPVLWWTPGPPCTGCYVPFYVHGRDLPEIVRRAGSAGKHVAPPPEAAADTYSALSYWWLFRELADRVKGDAIASIPGYYASRQPVVRQRFAALEAQFESEVEDVLAQARGAGEAGASVLDGHVKRSTERVAAAVRELLAAFPMPSMAR